MQNKTIVDANMEYFPQSREDEINNDLRNELAVNFIEYAVAVNTDRAIPDAKSGLKPVAKRILWSAFEKGRVSSKPHVKCARIVGDVMGEYHPHGDSSIYYAMIRLSQNWVMRYTLIDIHGSNGNAAGDGPAAMRYTEGRLSKLAEDGLLQGIKKKNVDFIPNYDETMDEPVTLPAIFPNLLCNPNMGIGVAMACSWLPHNLCEVAQAIYDYLDGKEPMLPGPDFPTGGIIINKNDIPGIMRTGHGSVKVRARYKVEKNNIVFYEIPYGETIEGLLSEIGEVCNKKEIEGITEIRDESNKKGIRIVIECGKGVNPDSIANKLYSKTNLQASISYNQVALVDKTPTELNLKQCIEIYVNHNIDCLIKETNTNLEEARERAEVVAGLLKALEDIDNIIKLIRGSQDSAEAKEKLIKLGFTERQAKAILAMRLSSLTKLDRVELNKEAQALSEQIDYYTLLLESKEEQLKVIRDRLQTIVKKYGDARRTELMHIEIPKEEKEIAEVVPVDVVVVTTQSGLIKKVPVSSYKVQRRGGKGVKSEDDAVMSTIKTNTVDYMMFFTNTGKMYRTVVDNIPDGTNATKGVPINSLVQLDQNEKVIAVTSLHRTTLPKFAIFITRHGMFKKTFLNEYLGAKRNAGIAAIKLREGDSVAAVSFQDDEEMIIISKNGMSIRFATKDIGAIGRLSIGVKGINLAEDDEVVAALPVHKETDKLAIFTANGLGKKVELKEFMIQGRGGKGTIASKVSETGNVVGAAMVSDEDNILVTGNKTSICFSATEVSSGSKASNGNIVIKDNRIISITKI
jgi:DNA gyrase subunit A